MSPEEFRKYGRAVVDWVADYMETVEDHPVRSRVKPGEIRSMLPLAPPAEGEEFDAILRDLDDVIMPGITHWQSPNFFAYFPANVSGPSILGELVSAALGVQGMMWITSPACTELETHVLDWLVDMLGLPERFRSTTAGGGVIQDTASSATLCALLAARERATSFAANASGVDRPLVAYTSSQAHSSVEKAMMIAGVGRERLRLVDVDGSFAMRPGALDAAIRRDVDAGGTPFFVCATVGTTSSTAIDPLPEIGRICRRSRLWLHVDAAMAGTAALCPEFRWIHDGLETADSYCFNPHKWMFTNFDCDCFWVADRAELINTLSILPEYLKNEATATGAVIDYRDWHIPLGRRFRALKLWFVIRSFGVEGLRRRVREHVRLAQDFARRVAADDRFELAVAPPLSLVCFRHVAGDETTGRLMDDLNDTGRVYLTHTRLGDALYIRMSIGQANTTEDHVDRAWALIDELAPR
ncbi:MAG: aspartate aminotransferase family protein [Planctomycetes bacterium]|nr:aspartate aminotransferase family protein [Planctomycetota bacterium]